MKYWLDTEFIEDGKTIDLISIGIVCEDGRKLYLINIDCDWTKANPFVLDNVLPNLPPRPDPSEKPTYEQLMQGWRFKEQIADEVMEFLGGEWASVPPNNSTQGKYIRRLKPGNPKPEIWAYYGSYDWVALCQLFGKMIDLPEGFPMYIHELKQYINSKGNPPLPKDYGVAHNALDDAIWCKLVWDSLQ